MSQLINQLYEEQLTEKGLADLRDKYPSTLVMDMTQDAEFKAARKIRTERNQLVEKIETRRKGVQAEIKTRGESLIEEVDKIFNPIISSFELEDANRKKEAARLKLLEDEKINDSKTQIQNIHGFVNQCNGKDAEYIQGMIESVDLIEVESFHKETIHDAIEAKKTTLSNLTQMLSDTIAREKLSEERAELAKEKAKLEADKAEFDAWKLCQEKNKDEEAAYREEMRLAEGRYESKLADQRLEQRSGASHTATVVTTQKVEQMQAPANEPVKTFKRLPTEIEAAFMAGFMVRHNQVDTPVNPKKEAAIMATKYSNDKEAA